MREARREDWRKRATKRKYSCVLRKADVWGAPALGAEVSIELEAPITVICGLNGSGKSRLLRVIAHLAHPGSVPDAKIESQVGSATGRLIVECDEETAAHDVPFEANQPITVLWFDPVLLTAGLCRQCDDLGSIVEVLDGVDPCPFDVEVMQCMRAIIQREYSEVIGYDLTEEGLRHPYFRAVWRGGVYGAEDMALGELSSAYLLYLLSRADPGTVVFLEEPESFLSPIGQKALMDALHYFCAKRGVTFVVSTHSPVIASAVPREHLCYVERSVKGDVIARSAPLPEMLAAMDLRQVLAGIVFVEDFLALYFVREILRRGCASYRQVVEVVVSGDKGRVVDAVRCVLPLGKRLPSVGVLDGDAQQDAIDVELPLVYLPGAMSPERCLRASVTDDPKHLAASLKIPLPKVVAALTRSDGADDHDWPHCVGVAVGLEYPAIASALIDAWLSVPANTGLAEKLYDDICRHIPGLL